MAAWLGPAISAGASILGGIFGKKSNDSSRAFQKEAMQKGVQWKVKDAKAAGLHPLYALGAQTSQPAAITGSAVGDAIAQAGSQIGRGIDQKYQRNRQAQLDNLAAEESRARTAKDLAHAQLFQSQVARSAQKANYIQDGTRNPFIGPALAKSKLMGLPAKGEGATFGGDGFEYDPSVSHLEHLSKRYDEWANLFAPAVIYKDFKHNKKKRNTVQKRHYKNTQRRRALNRLNQRPSAYRDSYR